MPILSTFTELLKKKMFNWKQLNELIIVIESRTLSAHKIIEIVRTASLQIMNVTNRCVFGNNTSGCSAAGLPAWPAVFLLLLLIPAGVVGYKYRSKIRRTFQSAHRSQKKEESNNASAADSHPYVHVRGQHSSKQMPIYENLTTQKAKRNAPRANQRR